MITFTTEIMIQTLYHHYNNKRHSVISKQPKQLKKTETKSKNYSKAALLKHNFTLSGSKNP